MVEYVHLHVTLLATTSPGANPEYFNLRAGSHVPSFVATTWDAVRHGEPTTPKPEFNSLNYLDQIKNVEEHGIDEWTVKIFSQDRISDEWLANVFGEGKVGWVYRKEVCFLFLFFSFHFRLIWWGCSSRRSRCTDLRKLVSSYSGMRMQRENQQSSSRPSSPILVSGTLTVLNRTSLTHLSYPPLYCCHTVLDFTFCLF